LLSQRIVSHHNSESNDIVRGAVAGMVGGLVGTFAMGTALAGWTLLSRRVYRRTFDPRSQREWRNRLANAGVKPGRLQQSEPRSHHRSISPSERLVAAAYRTVGRRPATRREMEVLGMVVHYAFGGVVGGLYGAAAEIEPEVTTGAGIPFGTAVWLVADELGIPLTGIADSPLRTPPRLHAYSLAGHLAYGLATEMTRRAIRRPSDRMVPT
jgi:uncharacterized membrane protein YagU involved in acid resistance